MNDWNLIWNAVEAFGTVVAAFGAGWFGWKQHEINKRLKDIQDFVAVSVIPLPGGGLNITNVGKVNLYLKKWEVGQSHEFFEKAILLPAVNGINITVSTPGNPGEYPIRLYLYDEQQEKYISEGKFFVDAVILGQMPSTEVKIEQGNSNSSQLQFGTRPRAYSFGTRKYKWSL